MASAAPALFRPDPDTEKGNVRSSSVHGVNFDLESEAMSQQAIAHVSTELACHEYPDAIPCCFATQTTWVSVGDDLPRPRDEKSVSRSHRTSVTTKTPSDDAPPLNLEKVEFLWIVETLCHFDRKLCVAVGRWRRSKRSKVRVKDSYIDLRIAMEALNLKNLDDERSQETRFRSPQLGAWLLAENLEERRSIRKTLPAAETEHRALRNAPESMMRG